MDTNTLTSEKLLKYSAALSTSKNPASAALDKLQIPHNNKMLQKRPARAAAGLMMSNGLPHLALHITLSISLSRCLSTSHFHPFSFSL